MNLAQLIDQVKSLSDYKPSSPTYQRDLEAAINDAYYTVWASAPWTFAHKTDYIELQPDVTPARIGVEVGDNISPTLVMVGGGLIAQTSGVAPRLTDRPDLWIGNILNVEGIEYVIARVERYYTGAPLFDYVARIWVTTPFRYDKTTSDWKVVQRYVGLPVDCEQPIALSYRPWPYSTTDYRPLQAISYNQEAMYGGYSTSIDKAWAYIREPSSHIPAGGKITFAYTNESATPTNGTFVPGDSVQICWAYVGPNETIGPLGEVATLAIPDTLTGTNYSFQLSITHMDGSLAASDAYTNPASHQYADINLTYGKVLFYNANWSNTTHKVLGPPKWIPINLAALSVSTYITNVYTRWVGLTESIFGPSTTSLDLRTKTYLSNRYANEYLQERPSGGGRIRLYPHPDGYDVVLADLGGWENPAGTTTSTTLPYEFSTKLSLYYRYLPAPLSFQTDAVEIPYEIASLVVYRALMTIALKSNNIAMMQSFERMYERGLVDAKKRYVTSRDVHIVKGMDLSGQTWRGRSSFWTTPVNYTG
jgi:hypothetical protein